MTTAIDKNSFSEPDVSSPLHYAIYEKKWFEEHKYFMGIDNHRAISSNEAIEDFIKNHCYDGFSLEEKCRIFYVNEFIIPTLFVGEASEKNICWIHSRLEDFCKLLSNHHLLNEKIAA